MVHLVNMASGGFRMKDWTVARLTNQVFGLALMTATALIMLLVTLLILEPADAPTALVLTIVLGSVTYVVRRFDTLWASILGLVVSLAAALTVFYIAFGVFQPFSPIEFVAGLLLVVGFLFALIGGVGAVIRHRRGSVPGGERLRQGALVLLGVATVVSIVGFFATRSTVDEAAAAGASVVDLQGFEFEPEEASVTAGGQILFTNSDAFAHDFTLEEFDLYTYLGPGSEALIDLGGLPSGTYTYFCSLHTFEGEGMIGTLTIQG